MALFPQQFIDDLRLQANIVQVVQEYVPLKRAGATYKGLCPFHGEKTPSFHVNPDKGFFHCFGCGVGGDVFKFLELQEKLSFPDAVRALAQKFGMSLPEPIDGDADQSRRDAALREALLKAHELAAAYFREQLAASAGARARQQLKERGLTQATIDQLGLGYAPNSRDGLKSRLLAQGFAPALLVQSGLVAQRDTGEIVDRFRNRLIVPICRDAGSVIAFGGRQMDPEQGGPKYLNSPETAIYSKGRTLYGLNLTKAQIRKTGFAVLVEGYFDFAQVFQSQAAPVVASCGTALTSQQAQLLRRFTSKLVLSFDPDAAGQGAAERSCQLLVSEGFEVNVVVLDRGEDPDTFIRKHGGAQYRERLRTSRPYLEYAINHAAADYDFRSVGDRQKFLERMTKFAELLPDQGDASNYRDNFAEKVAFRAGITDVLVREQFRKALAQRKRPTTEVAVSFGDLKPAERSLIWSILHHPTEALEALADLEETDLDELAGRDILEVARGLHGTPVDLLPSTLLQRLTTVNAQLVTSIAASDTSPAPAADCVRALKRLRWQREQAHIQREIDRLQQLGASQHGHEIDDLWQRKKDLTHRIEQLT